MSQVFDVLVKTTNQNLINLLARLDKNYISIKKRLSPQKKYAAAIFYDDSFIEQDPKKTKIIITTIKKIKRVNPKAKCIVFTHPSLRNEYYAGGATHSPDWFMDDAKLLKEVETIILNDSGESFSLERYKNEIQAGINIELLKDLEEFCQGSLSLGFSGACVYWKQPKDGQVKRIISVGCLSYATDNVLGPPQRLILKGLGSRANDVIVLNRKGKIIVWKDLNAARENVWCLVYPLRSKGELQGDLMLAVEEQRSFSEGLCKHLSSCVKNIITKYESVIRKNYYEILIDDTITSLYPTWTSEYGFFPSNSALINLARLARRDGELFLKLLENSPVGLIHVKDGIIQMFNRVTEDITGYTSKVGYGMHIENWHATLAQAKNIKKALKDNEYFQDRINMVKADGSIHPIRLTAFSMDKLNVFGFFEDVAPAEKDAHRLKALLEASTTLIKAKDSQDGLLNLAQELVNFLDGAYCQIVLLDEGKQKFRIQAAAGKGIPRRSWFNRYFSLDQCPSLSQMLESNVPLLFRQEDESGIDFELAKRLTRITKPLRALLLAPLRFKDKFMGFISVGEHRMMEQSDLQENLDVIQAIASQLSIWLHRAQIAEIAEIERRNLELCFHASNALVSISTPEEIMEKIVTQVQKITQAWLVSMIILDQTGAIKKWLNHGAPSQLDPEKIMEPEGLTMAAMQTGEPQFLSLKGDHAKNHPIMAKEGVVTAVCFPMPLHKERIGVIWIHFKKPHSFRSSETKALQLFVNQATIAYDYAHRLATQKRIREAVQLLNQADHERVRPMIGEAAKIALEADDISLWLFDKLGGQFFVELELNGSSKKNKRILDGFSSPFAKFLRELEDKEWTSLNKVEFWGFDGSTTPQSLQAVALRDGDKNYGILVASYLKKRSFGGDDEDIAVSFAQHVSTLLARTELLDRLAKARTATQMVAKVNSYENFEAALKIIAAGLKDLLQCDTVTICTYDQETSRVPHPPTMVGTKNKWPLKTGKVKNGGLIYRVLNLERLYWSNSLEKNEFFRDSTFIIKEKIQSCLALPLVVEDRKVGLMFVNYRSPQQFEKRELDDIELFAHQAAAAIQSARLYEQVRLQVQGLKALHKAGMNIVSPKNLEEIYQIIAETAWELARGLDGTEGQVHVCINHGDFYKIVATKPHKDINKVGDTIPLFDLKKPKGIVGRCINNSHPQLIDDVSNDCDYINYFQSGSQLAVPMMEGKRVIGALNIEHTNKFAFNEQHLLLMESLASQASIAIRYADDYKKLKDLKGFVGSRTAIEWMRMTNYTWAHAIRREVGTAWTNLELIRHYFPEPSPDFKESVDGMERALIQIKETPILEPLGSEDKTELIAINGLLETYLARRWAHEGYKDIQHVFKPDPKLDRHFRVKASKNWLRRGFEIIIENAVRAMRQLLTKKNVLTVETRMEMDKFVLIIITDTGKGIPAMVLAKIFEEQVESKDGAGIGLVQAGTIFQCYGGEITAANLPSEGAQFTIKLPLVPLHELQTTYHPTNATDS